MTWVVRVNPAPTINLVIAFPKLEIFFLGRFCDLDILLDLGFGHLRTTLIICIMNMFLIVVAYFLLDMNINFAITIFAVINFTLLYIPFLMKKKNDD